MLTSSSSAHLDARINFAFTLSQAVATYNYIFPTLVNFKFNRMFYDEICSFLGIKIGKTRNDSSSTKTATKPNQVLNKNVTDSQRQVKERNQKDYSFFIY